MLFPAELASGMAARRDIWKNSGNKSAEPEYDGISYNT